MGLLALMLLHESRRAARALAEGRPGPAGGPGPLALEPGTDRGGLGAGGAGARVAPRSAPTRSRPRSRRCTPRRRSAAATDWAEIVGLYDVLARASPSPVVELNRAVAVAMRDGPAAGLALIDAILAAGDLQDYHLAHAARADLCRRLGEDRGIARSVPARSRPCQTGTRAHISQTEAEGAGA